MTTSADAGLIGYDVGPFMGVTLDKTVEFEGHGKFRVIMYRAYNAHGLIGTENNGVAVLDEDQMDVVCDMIPREKYLELTVNPLWPEFQDIVNSSNRLRRRI